MRGFCDTITNGLILLLLISHKFEECILSTGLGLIMRDDEYLDADERRRASRLLDYDAAQEVVETLVSLKEGRCRLSWDAVGYQFRSFFGSMRSSHASEQSCCCPGSQDCVSQGVDHSPSCGMARFCAAIRIVGRSICPLARGRRPDACAPC